MHLESDLFWHFITSGNIDPWKPESHEQNTLLMQIVAEVAARYARAGYFTVVDGIVSPSWFLEPLRDALRTAGLRFAYAILRPPLPIALKRATVRSPRRLADSSVIEQLWNGFTDLDEALEAHIIDNGELSPEETAATIDAQLRLGALNV